MTSRSNCLRLLILLLACNAHKALAYEVGLSVGQYEPFDGVVNGVYQDDAPSYLLRLGVPRDNGLSWSSTLVYYEFKNRVANLENDVRLTALHSGFRKTFLEGDTERLLGVEPFFGASAGVVSLFVQPENNSTDTAYSEQARHGFSSSWEVGTQFKSRLVRNVDWEIKMTDLAVGRKLFGNMNMGGRIVSFGFQYNFSADTAH
ncbi:MAG TPA: hypothetical protein VE954_12175 [Oligoflexus sp.]|uniref:hypothetical protein n=1 Tax=Oligoflexus sp. TaxID=1971216 RepID=UPI002D5A1AF4|nr:hypothetical protein [Oligoflexus sp.]HYX33863.1 hypothetical protein [Oligoflexus sp.]